VPIHNAISPLIVLLFALLIVLSLLTCCVAGLAIGAKHWGVTLCPRGAHAQPDVVSVQENNYQRLDEQAE